MPGMILYHAGCPSKSFADLGQAEVFAQTIKDDWQQVEIVRAYKTKPDVLLRRYVQGVTKA